ncbi:MAG: polyphosphate kinase 1 [Gammaproteobacteria bacterium]|nr:MAG: polyphosphate kinase 1 [Gammaproteobacteria bacterium]
MDTPNLKLPDYYINRELSALEFNRRVLHQVVDPRTPLLERLKFICILSTNLDEFFEIRVSGLKQRLELGSAPAGPDMLTPQQVLNQLSERVHELVREQYRLLNDELIPALDSEGIRFIRRTRWNREQREWLREHFHKEIEPVLSPVTLDPARPFPRILNKSLNFIVGLKGVHAFGRPCDKAIVQAPRSLPRLIRLSPELADTGPNDFVFLSSVIHAFVDELFTGMEISGCYQFRVTRNSDLYVDEEEVDDLMRALEGELIASRYGAAVRLETAHDCPPALTSYLLQMFGLSEADLYQVDGPVNLNRLMAVYSLVDRDDLKDPPFSPGLPVVLGSDDDIFTAIRERDLLLHHPYQSFAPVLEFISRAAQDPDVLAIKITLYRAGADSPIIKALVAAAQAGKEVTVSVELRARFDEAANIELANRLQTAGAHVVYGVRGFKTHCKMAMVVRREGGRLVRYVHLSTGNYHPGTARVYTDYGLFSADPDLGEDVHHVFLQLTSMMQTPPAKRVLQAPFDLHDKVLELIEQEIRNVARGRAGHIIAKLNALVEPEVIRALYRASCAGVFVDLIVRGICCLRPGVPGVSDNIRVRSIVGRFLEHTRVYYFHADGEETVFCSSADWMDRNFFRRIELAFPILDPELKRRVIADLDIYLRDNQQAWELQADGSYRLLTPGPDEDPVSAQGTLLAQLAELPSVSA